MQVITRAFTTILLGVLTTLPAAATSLQTGPAATVLVPQFEVDLSDPNGVNTLVTVVNTRPTRALVHVIMWTNAGAPTIDFDLLLRGASSHVINLRDVFAGNVPIAHDTTDSTQWAGMPFCDSVFPGYINPAIVGARLERLVNGHTGQNVPSAGGCLGVNLGDNIARGYITMDVVNDCSLALSPGESGYIDGVLSAYNALSATVVRTDALNSQTHARPALHLRADSSIGLGDRSFWGRYIGMGSSSDQRQPLPNDYLAPFVVASPVASDTLISAWREAPAQLTGFSCGSPPQLATLAPVIIADSEGVLTADTLNFPLASQQVALSPVASSAQAGTAYFDLGHTDSQLGDASAQAWVGGVWVDPVGPSAFYPGTPLDSPPFAFPPPIQIVEISHRPDAVSDANGEWVEIFNPTDYSFDLSGWLLDDDLGSYAIASPLILAPGQRLVLCANDDPSSNGDFACDQAWGAALNLGDTSDSLVLSHPSLGEVDRVDWNIAFPSVDGASLIFTGTSDDDNNVAAAWMAATIREPGYVGMAGDLGSPGTQGTGQMASVLIEFRLE